MKKLSICRMIVIGILCFTLLSLNQNKSFASEVTPAPVDTSDSEANTLSEQEFVPSTENVKLLGRTYLLDDTLWLALSGTGIEFTFTGTKAEITLIGDNVATASWGERNYCRVGIYVNDKLVFDTLVKEEKKTITVYESDKEQITTVRVVKLSEAGNSTVGIGKIKVNSIGTIQPTEAKAHRIEFIGDSITCGYGIDGSRDEGFTTATENITKTYAYKTALDLNADYSMFALSGHGIISGYTSYGKLNEYQLIPKLYETLGTSGGGLFQGTVKANSLKWDFKNYVPEVIVINLGTNDGSYTGRSKAKLAEFSKGYVTFLKQVRKKNPKATIVCTSGMMFDVMFPSIESAIKTYTKKTGDKKVYSMKFDDPLSQDGFGASWHPSEKTNIKAAKKLTAYIKKIMKW